LRIEKVSFETRLDRKLSDSEFDDILDTFHDRCEADAMIDFVMSFVSDKLPELWEPTFEEKNETAVTVAAAA
jgi:hypothetical protein